MIMFKCIIDRFISPSTFSFNPRIPPSFQLRDQSPHQSIRIFAPFSYLFYEINFDPLPAHPPLRRIKRIKSHIPFFTRVELRISK